MFSQVGDKVIDAEARIFSEAKAALTAAFPTIFVTGEKVSAPPSFPAVSIVEISNSSYTRSQTEESKEHHASVAYEIECFSDLKTGRKSQCRAIAGVADAVMLGLNFTRNMLSPVGNAQADIARYVGRYTAVISEDGMLYRR